MKLDYSGSINKRQVQDSIYSKVITKKISGLAGPNSKEYADILRSYDFKDIILFENNIKVFLNQLYNPPKASLNYGDVWDSINNKRFYDLDFCCSILPMEHMLIHLKKIKQWSITLSLRPVGTDKTIETFYRYCPNTPYKIYKDTSPMIVFFNL